MTIRWGAPGERRPLRLTDRGLLVIVAAVTLLAVFTLPRLVCELAVYVSEAI